MASFEDLDPERQTRLQAMSDDLRESHRALGAMVGSDLGKVFDGINLMMLQLCSRAEHAEQRLDRLERSAGPVDSSPSPLKGVQE